LRALEVCYKCGRQLYAVDRCPHCGLTFCEKHMHPDAHLCLAFAKQRERRGEVFFLGLELCVFVIVAMSIYFITHVVGA
jgi:predicted amidophosphoribosyltransferase